MRIGEIRVETAGAVIMAIFTVFDIGMLIVSAKSGQPWIAGMFGFCTGWCLLAGINLMVQR